ncbi:MAG: hypothetical protein IT376_17585 [Polyangiaceae bacterium]|nr:hypothetical protein [Polyangiaceae bacterium]
MHKPTVLFGALLAAACGQDAGDRAPPCVSCGYSDAQGSGGTGGGDAEPPDAGPCEPNPAAGVTITGVVTQLVELTWPTKNAAYEGRAAVDFTGAPCGRAIASFDGSQADGGAATFTAVGVLQTGDHWFGVRPHPDETSVVGSILQANTDGDKDYPAGVTVVPVADLDAVYAGAGLTRDPSLATVLILLMEGSAIGLSPALGAEINFPGGTLAYEASGWGPTGGTGARGIVFALNVEAAEFPGENVTFSERLSDGTSGDEFGFRVAAGYVSIVRAVGSF